MAKLIKQIKSLWNNIKIKIRKKNKLKGKN